ncbi:outer membrane protein [Arachidicoccus rhizosphaerae]|uniref:Outer membrane protein n=1 Tax=Arachidicoccus rhizosphaerae TaxID=551991 RepID=A0A1H4APU5_9BACT|nr:TolC family protein [Arachidicoccus rhizosphaerae]SEA37916.1 outer membrane protein [Arachidicoccus rhizosphaerae]
MAIKQSHNKTSLCTAGSKFKFVALLVAAGFLAAAIPNPAQAQVPQTTQDSITVTDSAGIRPIDAAVSLNTADSLIWDLKTCLEYARAHNITIQTMQLTEQSAGKDLEQSKYNRLPSVDASISQNLNHQHSGTGINGTYGVNGDMTLYQGGYLKNDIKSKQLSLQAAGLDIQTTENDITLSITQAYLNILLAKENITYYKGLIESSQALVDQGAQFYKVGTVAKKNLLELQATLASDKYQLVNAENTAKQYILTLKQILQLPTGTNFDISSDANLQDVPALLPLTEAQNSALNTRPEVASSAINVEVEEAELAKIKAGLKPTLSLGGSVGSSYGSTISGGYFPQLNNNFYQQLGLTLSIPIFDRKQTRISASKADIAIKQAQLSLENTKLQLTQQVEQAYLNVNNALSQYEAALQQLTYAQEAYRVAGEEMKVSNYVTADYLQQKTVYVQAEQNFIQAKYTAALQARIYNFYAGIPVVNK